MVVEDRFAKVEDGGFGDAAIWVVVVGVDMLNIVRGIGGRAHVDEKAEG